MFEQAADTAHPRLIEAGGDQQLIGMEQRFVAFVVLDLEIGPALVTVAAQLIHRRRERFLHRRAFALHHHQRDAVH